MFPELLVVLREVLVVLGDAPPEVLERALHRGELFAELPANLCKIPLRLLGVVVQTLDDHLEIASEILEKDPELMDFLPELGRARFRCGPSGRQEIAVAEDERSDGLDTGPASL